MSTSPSKPPTKEEAVRAIYGYAASLLGQGKTEWQVEEALVAKGITKEAAAMVVSNLAKVRTNASRQSAIRLMGIGGVVCILGIIITVGSYSAAASSSSGGSYVVAWGAIVFGAIQFVRGLSRYRGG
jgi:uncharacterized membrane protein YiaA